MANLIKRSNQMNESHYRLKEVTQRVLALAIEQAQHIGIEKVLAGTKTIVVADYYAKVYGTSTQAAYEALKIAVDDMYYSEYVWQEIDDKGILINTALVLLVILVIWEDKALLSLF